MTKGVQVDDLFFRVRKRNRRTGEVEAYCWVRDEHRRDWWHKRPVEDTADVTRLPLEFLA